MRCLFSADQQRLGEIFWLDLNAILWNQLAIGVWFAFLLWFKMQFFFILISRSQAELVLMRPRDERPFLAIKLFFCKQLCVCIRDAAQTRSRFAHPGVRCLLPSPLFSVHNNLIVQTDYANPENLGPSRIDGPLKLDSWLIHLKSQRK